MELTVFLAVLAAALMHASWNLLVKLKLDRFLSLFLIQTLMGVMGLAMLLFFAWPSRESLPYALASGILHTGYNIFLARSYRDGDLSHGLSHCPRHRAPDYASGNMAGRQRANQRHDRHCNRHTGVWHMAGCGRQIKVPQT